MNGGDVAEFSNYWHSAFVMWNLFPSAWVIMCRDPVLSDLPKAVGAAVLMHRAPVTSSDLSPGNVQPRPQMLLWK